MLLAQISKPSLSDAGTELKQSRALASLQKARLKRDPAVHPSRMLHRRVQTNRTKTFWLLFQVTLLRATAGSLVTRSAFLPRCGDRGEAASAFSLSSELTARRPATAPRERSVLRYNHRAWQPQRLLDNWIRKASLRSAQLRPAGSDPRVSVMV